MVEPSADENITMDNDHEECATGPVEAPVVPSQQMSKKAMKRMAKREKMLSQRVEWKLQRAATKRKRDEEARGGNVGTVEATAEGLPNPEMELRRAEKRQRKEQEKKDFLDKCQ